MLRLLDAGETDDKLIAVPLSPYHASGFSSVHTLAELDARYRGVRTILATWFAFYDGSEVTEVLGWGDETAAQAILEHAVRAAAPP